MVPPGLGPEQAEEAGGQVEHGHGGLEHLVDGVNEAL